MSNLVPDGWSLTTLGSNARLITDGAHASPPTCEGGKPIATVQNMLSRSIDVGSCRSISEDDFDMLVRGNCSPITGDVLFSKDGTVGKTFVYRQSDIVVLLSSIAIIRLFQDKVEPEFCSQYLLSPLFYQKLENAKSGSAIRRIVLSDLKKIELPTPPLPEQQKIAAILSSVDDVIEKTRAQIDKLKDLKTGMMQELLAKGIGHTAFKDSPVGRIPEGWEVGAISDFGVEVLDGDRGKQYPKESDFQPWGHCLFLSAKNVTKAGFKFSEMVFISEEKDSALRKGKLQRGDIVITTRGTVGNIAFYTDGVPYKSIRINSGMAIIRNQKNEISPNFLNLLMVSPIVTEQIELLAFGSAQPQLTIGIIKGLVVPKPSLDEQNRISLAISSVDTKQRLASQKLDAMLLLKKALMQDLLTGKVRVNVDNKENAVA